MNVIEIAIGITLIVMAGFAFWLAVPKSDGQVRPWLKGDSREWPYAIFVLGLTVLGVSQIITGLVP
jgi:hypothetical protein